MPSQKSFLYLFQFLVDSQKKKKFSISSNFCFSFGIMLLSKVAADLELLFCQIVAIF